MCPQGPCFGQGQTVLVLLILFSLIFLTDFASSLPFPASVNFTLSRGHSHQHTTCSRTFQPEKQNQHCFLELTLPPATAPLSASAEAETSRRSHLGLQPSFSHVPVSVLPCLQTACVKVPVASAWLELTTVPISISLPTQQHQCSDRSWFSLAAPLLWLPLLTAFAGFSTCSAQVLVSGLWAQPCISATWSMPLPGTPLLGVAAVTSLAPCCHPDLSGVQCRYELKCKSRHTSLFKAPHQFSVLSRPMRLT